MPKKGFKFSEESKAKMRASHLGQQHTAETRAKLSAALKGKTTGPKGRKTEAQKAAHLKGMQKLRGKKRPEHVRARISATLMGHEGPSAEMRQVMSSKAREHATVNFSGGQIAIAFAEVLSPVGYVREHYLYYGEQVVPLGPFAMRRRFIRLDFAHLEAKVDIELDGEGHNEPEQVSEDARRDAILKGLGWRVIRIKV
ncbi:MAG: endonuclease domain-containing protein [Sulfuricaulis sp.]|nr:endonuclease domain-containing protein [Sulfuricaulis sp.]